MQFFKSSHESGKIVKTESVVNLDKESKFNNFDSVLSKEIEKYNQKKMKKQVIFFLIKKLKNKKLKLKKIAKKIVEDQDKLFNYMKIAQKKEEYLKDLLNKTNRTRVF